MDIALKEAEDELLKNFSMEDLTALNGLLDKF